MEADPTKMARIDEPARHAWAGRALAARGEAGLARGAANLAAVTAYRLAAAPSRNATAFHARVGRLRALVVALDAGHRAHVAALIDAALGAEVEARLAVGLAPHDGRLGGWMDPALDADGRGDACDGDGDVTAGARASYATAGAADDVDVVLARAIHLIRRMVAAGGSTPAGLVDLEAEAFGLCVRPSRSPAERADRRRTILILWLTLRRRRPLAAAVLRAQLRRDRAGSAPSEGG